MLAKRFVTNQLMYTFEYRHRVTTLTIAG
jgi:hypothetical protein